MCRLSAPLGYKGCSGALTVAVTCCVGEGLVLDLQLMKNLAKAIASSSGTVCFQKGLLLLAGRVTHLRRMLTNSRHQSCRNYSGPRSLLVPYKKLEIVHLI